MKTLTNVTLKNSRRKNVQRDKKSVILEGLSFLIVFSTLALTMIYSSYTITKKLDEINQSYAFINILFLMNFIVLFTKSIFESLNVLYFSKDLKLLLRMPLKPKDILHSKILNMIISEYEMEFIMLAIPMIVYGMLEGVTITFYIYMLIILLFLPIIPIMITSLIISIIMRFTNFIKDKTKVMYITIIASLFIIGLLTANLNVQGSFSSQGFESILLKANGLAKSISSNFVLIKPIMNTMLNYDNINGIKNLVIYIIENIVCYGVGILIMSKVYLKGAIGTTINSKKAARKNKKIELADFKAKKFKKAYLAKEKTVLKRTPIFFIQCLIIPLLYPSVILSIIIGILSFSKLSVPNLLDTLYENLVTSFGAAIFLTIGQIFYMTNFSSIIAVSRDSKSAKLIKYLPIELEQQFKLKLNIGIKINMIIAILISICNYIIIKDLWIAIAIFICLTLLNYIGEKFKLLIDLRKPKLNWESEYTMMKQNTNVMDILFYTLIVIGIVLGMTQIIINIKAYLLTIVVGLAIINIVLNKYIRKNEREIFSRVY